MSDSINSSFFRIQRRDRLMISLSILAAVILANIIFLLNNYTLVSSHLYYIPILLFVIWFGREGMYVSLCIILFYISSSLLLLNDPAVIIEILLRALIMLSVAVIISLLSREFVKNFSGFNALFRNIPAPAINMDNSGKILDVNDKFADLVKFKYTDLKGRNILELELFSGENLKKINYSVKKCIAGEIPEDSVICTEVVTPDGIKNYNLLFIMISQNRRNFGFIMVLYDVTEILAAKSELLRINELLDNIISFLPVPAFAMDRDHIITRWNVALENYTGISAGDIIGTKDAWKPFFKEKTPMLADLVIDHKGRDSELSSYDPSAFGYNGIEETRHFNNPGGIGDTWFRMSAELLKDNNGNITGAIQVFEDITGLKKTEKELLESRELYRDVVDVNSEYIVRFRDDRTITFCNEAYCRLLGKSPEEISGNLFGLDICGENISLFSDFFSSLTPDKFSGSVENRAVLPDGNTCWIRWDIVAFFDEHGDVREYQAIGRDITDQKNAIEDLLKAEKKFRDLCDFLPQTVFELDIKRNVVFLNKRGYDKLGYSPDDLNKGLGFLDLVIPEDHNRALDNIVLSSYGRELGIRYTMKKKDGTLFDAMLFTSPIMRGRTPVGVRGIVIDLSNVKEPDAVYNLSNNLYIENLKESLREKETLLKEVHHRVKNNLQIITSILRLHSYNTSDQGLKDILQECYNQVYSMSMLHEKMYRSDTLSDVGADDHIRSLGSYLINEISARGADVRFLADIDPEIRFSLDKGIPLSLMLNEMITNSLKYAFSGDGPGQISISLQKYNSGNYRLIYSDNGCGLPEGFRIEDSESLGFELITNLAEQLDGKLEIENNGGLKYILIFPVQ